jgi:hypothetical protein
MKLWLIRLLSLFFTIVIFYLLPEDILIPFESFCEILVPGNYYNSFFLDPCLPLPLHVFLIIVLFVFIVFIIYKSIVKLQNFYERILR